MTKIVIGGQLAKEPFATIIVALPANQLSLIGMY